MSKLTILPKINVKIVLLIMFSGIVLFVPQIISAEQENLVKINTMAINEKCVISDTCLIPSKMTICNGSKVTWLNESTGMYRVASGHVYKHDDVWGSTGTEDFWSEFLTTNQTFSYTFTENRIYEYYLYPAIFPNGKIIVDSCNSLNTKLSLKQQIENAVPLNDIICSEDKVLVLKSSNNIPACIFSNSIQKLTERGWIGNIIKIEPQVFEEIESESVNKYTLDPEFKVQNARATEILVQTFEDDKIPYLGMTIGKDRKSLLIGIDSTKLTEEKGQEYYEKYIQEKFAEITVPIIVEFKVPQGGDE